MNVIRRRGWEIPEREATPEHLSQPPRLPGRDRRRRDRAVAGACRGAARHRPAGSERRPLSGQAQRDDTRSTGRSPTRRSTPTTTISTNSARPRTIARAAQALKLRPWPIKLDGMVEKEQELDIDDLLRKVALEERLYRHALCRGLVDVDAVVRLSDGEARRAGAAVVVREVCADGNLQRPVDGVGATAASGIRGPIPKG